MLCERWPYRFGLNSQQPILPNLKSMKSVKTEFWVCPSVMSNLLLQVSQCHSPPNFSVTAQEVTFSLLYVHIMIHIIFICRRQWTMEFMRGLTFFARTLAEKFLIFQDQSSVTCEEVISECVKVAWKLNCRGQMNSYIPGKCSVRMWCLTWQLPCSGS